MSGVAPRIAGAPISWGVCEASDWGLQLEPDVVLAELAAAGYQATEAGPDGWLPGDGAGLRGALDAHGLELAGAFLLFPLGSRGSIDAATATFDVVVERLAGSPGAVLNVAIEEEGADADWRTILAALDELDARARDRGVTCALHPHAGTAVERGQDLQRVLEGCGIGLCLDTGHLFLGGIDPLEIVEGAADRIVHVHLKDIDAGIADRWRGGTYGSMREAVGAGVWRPLGSGDVGVAACLSLLAQRSYRGWYVIERDTSLSPADAAASGARVAAAAKERAWVEAQVASVGSAT